MLGIPLGLAAANAGEWLIHKYVLHGLGRNKDSYWAFHWHDHHRAARRNEHVDDCYEGTVFAWDARGKEALGLAGAALAVAPLFPVAPFFTGALWYSALRYYKVHKRAHEDGDWARENLPWHYAHHMGPNQDSNWCVTHPWFDHVMGTREPYVGTPREKEDAIKRRRLAERRARRAAARG